MADSISATAAPQYGYQQFVLQQARRAAEKAEQNAQDLQARARAARQEADRADTAARTLELQTGDAKTAVALTRSGFKMLESRQAQQARLAHDDNRNTAASAAPPPVRNSQGQLLGRQVSLTA